MSVHSKARRGLPFVDPAAFTPQYSWKAVGTGRAVYCEGVSLQHVAKRFGTPMYVYSQRAITDAVAEFETGLQGVPHRLCFAVKANGNLSLLKLLASRGCGFDIVSGGELDHLGRIGVPGDRIVFSGVGKSREEIREALRYKSPRGAGRGILQFNVESEAELGLLLEEAGRARCVPGASVRVNPDVKAGGHPHISTGLHEHKFGLPWPAARALYTSPAAAGRVRWQGISAHIGSQIVDLAPFRTAVERLTGYLLELRGKGIALRYLDIGGGLGVRYTDEKNPSRKAYARLVAQIARPLGVELLLEPGRSIIASSGVLLTRVLYRKHNGRKSFVIVDAAMNDFARPILYDAPHPVSRVTSPTRPGNQAALRADIVGPICESGDCFLLDWPLGPAESGDLLAIWGAGAYGFAQASNYNGRPRPAEVLVNGRTARLIRRRESKQDLLRTDVLG